MECNELIEKTKRAWAMKLNESPSHVAVRGQS